MLLARMLLRVPERNELREGAGYAWLKFGLQ